MRQQLGLWARQAAAVRAGSLQLSCELAAWTRRRLGAPVAPTQTGWQQSATTTLHADIVLTPVTGAGQDLRTLMSPTPPSTPPGSAWP